MTGARALLIFLSAVLVLAPAGAAASPPRPRALSEAERAAVELAAAYLHDGPEAWWERLAAGSPLRRLGQEAALDEIAARVGPAEGASWQLLTPGPSLGPETAVFGVEFASGLDETLVLRLADEDGWKISEIRISADPVRLGPRPRILNAAAPSPAPPAREPARSPFPLRAAAALLVLGIAGGLAMFLLARAGRSSAAIAAGAAIVIIGLVVGLWGWISTSATAPSLGSWTAPRRTAHADPGFLPLGELAPLRAALAAGTDRAEIERRLATPPEDVRLREVQDLWRAHYRLAEADLTAVDEILGRFPPPANYALAELLRARLAFRRLEREDTGWFYEQAIARGLDHDGLRLESVLAKALTNEGDRAETEITALLGMGSRLGDAWYTAAQIAVARGQMEEAEDLLRAAWEHHPAPREALFDDPILAWLVTRPKLFPLFQLGNPEETQPAPEGASRPLAVPAGTQATTCGRALRLAVGEAELLVPGGAPFAPAGAVLESAGAWSRHGEEKALAALPSLTGGSKGEIFQPRRLRLAEQAGRALAGQNRWSELVALTEPLANEVARAPATLLRLRARALQRLERNEEARQLLIRLAGTDIASRRPAPGTLLDLSELFAAAGEYDTAIKLSLKADSQLPEPRGDRRRKQLAMDRDLAASFASHRSEHFDVRYPEATGERYARGVAWVLEEERTRLLQWIPQPGKGKPIEVHLFPLRDFLENYGGDIGVIGLFDGKVRVPFAEIRSLHPQLIAILSHEVAHAMIAAATRDQAPHWFQEGLAQHIEMGTGRVNPLPDLARTRRALSFPTIDPILRGFAEPQLVDLAYSEAAWALHFIEARFGVKAIHRLLAAFAAGKTTEAALREVCGLSPADFDRALWQWGTGQAPGARNLAVRRYDVERDVKMAKEQTQQVKEVLRVGVSQKARDELARREQEAGERRGRMAAWHAAYATRAADVKRSLKPILDVYQKGGRADTLAACTELATGAVKMLDDPGLWTSPDRDVNQTLQEAYRALGNLGQACRTGRDNEVRFLITEVDKALSEAAQRLEPYGLAP